MKNLSVIDHDLDMVTKKYVDDAAEAKVDKIEGKQLSTNDFTTEEKNKLNSLENYTLPAASADALGGVKIGNNLAIDENGVLNIDDIDYSELENKPTLNGVEISGNMTSEDLGINSSNIAYGSEEPTDENTVVWIDPSGTSSSENNISEFLQSYLLAIGTYNEPIIEIQNIKITISASENNENAYKIMDGGTGAWTSTNVPSLNNPQWINIHYEMPKKITSFNIILPSTGSGFCPKYWKIKADKNDGNWVVLYDNTVLRGNEWTQEISQNIDFYNNYRLEITETVGATNYTPYAYVTEFKPVAETDPATPNFTSNIILNSFYPKERLGTTSNKILIASIALILILVLALSITACITSKPINSTNSNTSSTNNKND